MTIRSNFVAWCQLRGLNPIRTIYMEESLWDMREGDARLVRTVRADKRAGNRVPQKYVVEQLVNDTISYPFGTVPMEEKELLRRLIRSTLERTA